MNRFQGPIRHNQADKYMHYRSLREKERQKE